MERVNPLVLEDDLGEMSPKTSPLSKRKFWAQPAYQTLANSIVHADAPFHSTSTSGYDTPVG